MDGKTTHLPTNREAGQLLCMLPARVTRFAKRGVIPHVVLPDGELRFVESDLWAWVESQKQVAKGKQVTDATAQLARIEAKLDAIFARTAAPLIHWISIEGAALYCSSSFVVIHFYSPLYLNMLLPKTVVQRRAGAWQFGAPSTQRISHDRTQ